MALAAILCMVSCSESYDSLSDSTAWSLVKKELQRLNRLEGCFAIQTGFYECNDNDQRYLYRQLAANELITYKCDKVKKTERRQKTRRMASCGFEIVWSSDAFCYQTDNMIRFADVAKHLTRLKPFVTKDFSHRK